MMTRVARYDPISTLEQRVEWLLAHPDVLQRVLDGTPQLEAFQGMQRDGLFARSTNWFDISLDKAITQARMRLRATE